MATIHTSQSTSAESAFFLRFAIAISLIVATGFSLQLAAGRSSFAAPLLIHAHAVVFMGWIAIYLLQSLLVAKGAISLHRALGWLGTLWIVPMIVLGFLVMGDMVRRGQTPFFFRPQQFLIFNPLNLLTFAGLTGAAIAVRRRTDWHRRLHLCGTAALIAPAFGRILPMPLLMPWAFEMTFVAIAGLVAVAAGLDRRRIGCLHGAWRWGFGTFVAFFVLAETIPYTVLGDRIYAWAVAGSPGASIAPMEFPPPPTSARITSRG